MRWKPLIVFVLGGALVGVVMVLPSWMEQRFGKAYRFDDEDDRLALRRIAYACSPAIVAADAALASGRKFELLDPLEGLPPSFVKDMELLSLRRTSEGYVLMYHLNWDARLFYRSEQGYWEFDEGQGTGEGGRLWESYEKGRE